MAAGAPSLCESSHGFNSSWKALLQLAEKVARAPAHREVAAAKTLKQVLPF